MGSGLSTTECIPGAAPSLGDLLFGCCDAMLIVLQLQLTHPAGTLQSWLYGKVIERLEPEAMALGESHGYETADSKRYMRQSVMISDLIGVFASA